MCNDKIVSCADDGSIMIWSPGTWTCARSMEGHTSSVNAVVECRGRLASAGDDGVIKLWGIDSWVCEVTVHHTSVDNDESSQVKYFYIVLFYFIWFSFILSFFLFIY